MAIVIEPQILDIETVNPIDIEIGTSGGANIDVSTSSSSVADISASAWSNNYDALYNKPKINGHTLIGDKSSEELDIVEDKNYLHSQTVASDTWVIVHNLNKYPAVSVIDSAGNEVVGEVIYNDANQVTLKFKGGFKGTATLN